MISAFPSSFLAAFAALIPAALAPIITIFLWVDRISASYKFEVLAID